MSGVVTEVFPREGGWFDVELRSNPYACVLALRKFVVHVHVEKLQ